MYWPADLAEAELIAARARELRVHTIRYLLSLQTFEERPAAGHPKRASYDLLIAALQGVVERLAAMAPLERSDERSEE